MEKRHFQALAAALYDSRPDSKGQLPEARTFRIHQWGKDVERVANVCATFNPRFRCADFYEACGYDAEYGRV